MPLKLLFEIIRNLLVWLLVRWREILICSGTRSADQMQMLQAVEFLASPAGGLHLSQLPSILIPW
jgi:hypothetical protein